MTTARIVDGTTAPGPAPARTRLWIVGPGFHFLGGLSVYTCRLANELADGREVTALLLRRLIPTRLYPGGARAGQDLTSLRYDPRVRILGQLDWYWGRALGRAVAALRADRPDLLLLQWWTAATLHTYLVLAFAARRLGIPVVIEFHEVQDTGEASVPLVSGYRRVLFPLLLAWASGALVHTRHDLETLRSAYGPAMARLPVEIAPHGPYDHLPAPTAPAAPAAPAAPMARDTAAPTTTDQADRANQTDQTDQGSDPDESVTRLLFFGLVRPYKGLEDLVVAFNTMPREQAERFRLMIVGETWEGWDRPAELVAASPHPELITFVNRYVTDLEAAAFFADADAVVLPYRRGSASGPLQIAMSNGLHVVVSDVGGLTEAVQDYDGAILVPPGDVDALREALLRLPAVRTKRFADPHSWAVTGAAIDTLATRVAASGRVAPAGPAVGAGRG